MTKQQCIVDLLPYAAPIKTFMVAMDMPLGAYSPGIEQTSHSPFEHAAAQALLFLLGHEAGLSDG